MNCVFVYVFEDGTVFKLLDAGFSSEEIFRLIDIHGKLINSYVEEGKFEVWD